MEALVGNDSVRREEVLVDDVIASEAKQSHWADNCKSKDCFVATLLAMTPKDVTVVANQLAHPETLSLAPAIEKLISASARFPKFGGVFRAALVGSFLDRQARCLSHQYRGWESSFIVSSARIRHPITNWTNNSAAARGG
jgi:hypothetical protein